MPKRKRLTADLPLAPLTSFTAADYFKTDFESDEEEELAEFMLMAALTFNDFKDLALFESWLLEKHPPEDGAVTPEVGEYWGLRAHLHRMLVAFLNEVLELIREHRDLYGTPAFRRCLGRLGEEARSAWSDLCAASSRSGHGKHEGKGLRRVLADVRANVASHYYQPRALARGFRAFAAPTGKKAYVSLGQTAESSRFYFADAGAQKYAEDTLRSGSASPEQLVEVVGNVNDAIRMLVQSYLIQRRLIPSGPRP